MSSVLRGAANIPTKDHQISTKFVNLTTLSYADADLSGASPFLPIPFTYENGVIDIRVQNGVQASLLDTFSPVVAPISFNLVKPMGGSGLVHTLGENFKTFLNNLTFGTDFALHTPGIMTKVQQPTNVVTPDISGGNIFENSYMGQFSAVGVSTAPPSDDFAITGSDADEFGTFWVFQTPLTIRYSFSAVEYYMTFTTTFTKNIPLL